MFLHIGSQKEIPIQDLVAIIQTKQDDQQSCRTLVITTAQTFSSPISAQTLRKRLREIASLFSPSGNGSL